MQAKGIKIFRDAREPLFHGWFSRSFYNASAIIIVFFRTSEKDEDYKNAQKTVHRAHFSVHLTGGDQGDFSHISGCTSVISGKSFGILPDF